MSSKTYAPMSRETHLDRGKCCTRGCVYCPWYVPKKVHMEVDPRIEAALRSGETVTLYINRKSLVPSVTLLNRVTLIYQPA